MAIAAEPNACKNCARAKKKCDKQKPCCFRCKDRGINCAYPLPKPSSFVRLEDTTLPDNLLSSEATDLTTSTLPTYLCNNLDNLQVLDLTIPSCHSRPTWPLSVWFLSPEAWKIDHRPLPNTDSFCPIELKRWLAVIQRWFERWVTTGSNPFIHSHLYSSRSPSCVQIAYTALSSYISRVESNTDIILRIVDHQASELLVNNGVLLDNLNQDDCATAVEPTTVLEHFARVHALAVYQLIGLFDGDIRSRHLAEARMHILDRWATQMVEWSCHNLSLPEAFNLTGADLSNSFDPTSGAEVLWHAWSLTESVRRTWYVAKGLQSLYLMLQQGWTYCPGGMMFTTRQGVWEADTAFAWQKLCSEVDVGFIQRFEAEEILAQCGPSDLDEFAEMLLEMTFGGTRMERWRLKRNEV